jgi:D-alanine transaminase
LNLLPNVLAKQKAKKMGYYDAIFFSELGVTEGTSNSVLAVMNGVLVTAPPGPWILPGITRKTVLGIARNCGIPSEEKFFTPQELMQADEVMLTSTRIGVLPVVGLNGSKVNSGVPGPVYRLLAEQFARLITL